MSIEAGYTFKENPGFFGTIVFYRNPREVHLNYIQLYINAQITNHTKASIVIEKVNDYINEVFQGVEVTIREGVAHEFTRVYQEGQAAEGESYVDRLDIPKYDDARKVVDILWRRQEISEGNRADMQYALGKIEQSAEYAKKINDDVQLSVAQTNLIEEMALPYIEGIKEEMPSIEMAKACIYSASRVVRWSSLTKNTTCEDMRVYLPSRYENQGDEFYDCLFALARIWTLRAELEGAFSQTGSTSPSEKQIVDIISKTVHKSYRPLR